MTAFDYFAPKKTVSRQELINYLKESSDRLHEMENSADEDLANVGDRLLVTVEDGASFDDEED